MHTLGDSDLLKKLQTELKPESQPKPKPVFKQKKKKQNVQNDFADIEREFLNANVKEVDMNDPEFSHLPKPQKASPKQAPKLKQTDRQVPELRDDVDIGKYFGEGE